MSLEYIKTKSKKIGEELYLPGIIILVGLFGFGLGRLSKIEESRIPVTVRIKDDTSVIQTAPLAGLYLASRTGNSYYLPWCAGAQKIKEVNKIWFKSRVLAEAAGYKKAINCKGI